MRQSDGGEFEDVFQVSGWHVLVMMGLVVYVVMVSTYREILDRLSGSDSIQE
jgi:hypothetical protein